MLVNSTDFQNAVGRYLVLCSKEDIIITKNGKSVAKLVAYTEPLHFFISEAEANYNAKRRINYEEFQSFVDASDQRYELIDGVVYLLASPTFKHQVLVREFASRIQEQLSNSVYEVVTAPFDIRLYGHAAKFEEDPNVVQPDLAVICDVENVQADGKYEGIPSLVVEVLSPATRSKDLVTKLNLYMRSGIREYWVVDPESNQVWQYSFSQERELDHVSLYAESGQLISSHFPCLKISLSEIFRQ
ncbi:MAG TPA: type II toxin-antitoxin system Phd/YefM family antitoxin [Firmicutes bacterium]|nr:type II toxin-antitoxin system Phd/YefM family antitoxin [Bacillota bacterium]